MGTDSIHTSQESILMRVKEEYKAKNITRRFEDTFEWYKKKYET